MTSGTWARTRSRPTSRRYRRRCPASTSPRGFLPATSPGCFALTAPNLQYDSYENYLFALARVLREEYRAIVQSGLLLQIDCPDLPMAVHTSSWDNTSKRIGYQKYLELHVAALNEAVAGLPPDRMRMHICWGNYQGPHHMDVDLTEVLPAVFEARPAAIVSPRRSGPGRSSAGRLPASAPSSGRRCHAGAGRGW